MDPRRLASCVHKRSLRAVIFLWQCKRLQLSHRMGHNSLASPSTIAYSFWQLRQALRVVFWNSKCNCSCRYSYNYLRAVPWQMDGSARQYPLPSIPRANRLAILYTFLKGFFHARLILCLLLAGVATTVSRAQEPANPASGGSAQTQAKAASSSPEQRVVLKVGNVQV